MGKYFTVLVAVTIFIFLQYEVDARPPLGIINGTKAAEGEFPYLVQLYDRNDIFECGGAIIGDEWILSAGHCVQGEFITRIVHGSNQLHEDDVETYNNTIAVKAWFPHPQFGVTDDYFIPIYDIGILQLAKKIPLSEKAQLLKLPESSQMVPFHLEGVLAGWGQNKVGGLSTQDLQKADLQLLTEEECSNLIDGYNHKKTFNSTQFICSDDYLSRACHGDSGSPYVINGIQYGIVSWTVQPCGVAPVAYTQITNPEFRDWIKKITNI